MSESPLRPDLTAPGVEGAVASGALRPGELVAGRYRLDAPIASGGMATVWRASDTVLTRPVAVKILHPHLAADPEFVARFRREAVAAARLTHSSIVAIYDTCADPEAIVMELVEGRTLRDELDRRSFLPAQEAVDIASGILQALQVAHTAGIIHRDIKPANVLLSVDGHLKVADFGIAKALRDLEGDPELPDLTAQGRMVGTAKYLAPEQVSGADVDERADVYATGAVLYELLCGRPPFAGANDLATATARLHGPPERPRSVLRTIPQRLDDIVMRALARDRADRYPSASAMWAELQSVVVDDDVAGVAASVDPTLVGDRPTFAETERSWLVPTLLIGLVAGSLGLAWVLIGGTQAREEFFDLVDRVAPGGEPVLGGADPSPLTLAAVSTFDPPPGDGSERDDEVGFVVDDDALSSWRTETYTNRSFGNLKDGVGVIFTFDGSVEVDEVILTSPSSGWSAELIVTDTAGPNRAAWGEADARVDGATPGTTTVDLDDAAGSRLLLWLTDLGEDDAVRFELSEVTITGVARS